METKTILAAGLVVTYVATHVGLGAEVPGKPLTVMVNVVAVSSSASLASSSLTIPNLANPYGSDFALPPIDPRAVKLTLA